MPQHDHDITSLNKVPGHSECCWDTKRLTLCSVKIGTMSKVNESSWSQGHCFLDIRLPLVSNKPLSYSVIERKRDKTSVRVDEADQI